MGRGNSLGEEPIPEVGGGLGPIQAEGGRETDPEEGRAIHVEDPAIQVEGVRVLAARATLEEVGPGKQDDQEVGPEKLGGLEEVPGIRADQEPIQEAAEGFRDRQQVDYHFLDYLKDLHFALHLEPMVSPALIAASRSCRHLCAWPRHVASPPLP